MSIFIVFALIGIKGVCMVDKKYVVCQFRKFKKIKKNKVSRKMLKIR